jgi:hypothetical protein
LFKVALATRGPRLLPCPCEHREQIAAKMAIIAITTSSSMSVKPNPTCFLIFISHRLLE